MDILDKAYRAAQIFAKLNYKGYSAWVIEKITTQRLVVGNTSTINLYSPLLKTGIREEIVIQPFPHGIIRYDPEDAYLIAISLQQKMEDG